MANNLPEPRTVFHRRLQGVNDWLATGFEQLQTDFGILNERLETGFNGLSDRLVELTEAVKVPSHSVEAIVQILHTPIRVIIGDEDWDIVSINACDSIRIAMTVMLRHNLTAVVIYRKPINSDQVSLKKQSFVGMITCDQILKAVNQEELDTPVQKFMVSENEVIRVTPDDTVEQALNLFKSTVTKRMIVFDNYGNVKAVLTSGMLLRWLTEMLTKLMELRPDGAA